MVEKVDEIKEIENSIENLDINGGEENKTKPKKRNKKKPANKAKEDVVETEDKVEATKSSEGQQKEEKKIELVAESSDEEPDSPETKVSSTKKKKKRSKKKKDPSEQTEPPTIPVTKFYAPSNFPLGELQPYGEDNVWRVTSEEKRYLERQNATIYAELRRSAEAHRQVRKYAQKIAKPGIAMVDLCEAIENGTRNLIEAEGLTSGIGFPTGVSLNHCAAHYTPNPGDKTVLKQDDVMKIDFGVHVNGRIIDSAFTVTFDEKYDPLLEAVKNATYAGIKTAGIDVRLCEVGAAVQEVMESYEIELDGKTYPIKAIKSLNGHSIEPYTIHAGKSVPVSDNGDQTKMEEGEVFAIETFGSTGTGNIRNDLDCSHFALNSEGFPTIHGKPKAKALLDKIKETFGNLPFCRRFLDRIGETRHLLPLRQLVDYGIVTDYPPLVDIRGSYTAQFEHTIILRPTVKEVLSKGDDY